MPLSSSDLQPLKSACHIVCKDVLRVQQGETALIITNPQIEVYSISLAMCQALTNHGACVSVIVQPIKTTLDFCEDSVAQAIRSNPNILISLSANKLGKDKVALKNPYIVDGVPVNSHFQYLLASGQSRGFWAPGITREIFISAIPVDYRQIKLDCQKLKEQLDAAVSLHIVTPAGTDLHVDIADRKAFIDDGDFTSAGLGGNLPAGETFISPSLYKAHGRIVFDGSLDLKDGTIMVKHPVTLIIKDGLVTEITGQEEARLLEETLQHGENLAQQFEKEGKIKTGEGALYAKNARHLGEIGIGVHPLTRVMGNMLIDEKISKTCHIAIGSNYDEDGPALIHQDCLCLNPTITLTYEDSSKKFLEIS